MRLPNRNEFALAASALVVLLFASWLRRGEKIARLEANLAAKPKIEYKDRIVEKRVVVKGPVRVVKVVVKSPDGTTTTQSISDKAEETVETDKARDVEKVETPICPPPRRAPSRFFGFVVGRDGYQGSWIKGVRAGINVLENWDLGANVVRERSGASVVGGDISFRW